MAPCPGSGTRRRPDIPPTNDARSATHSQVHLHRGGDRHGRARPRPRPHTDGELDVQLRPPNEGGGTNPEQLFAVGYAACFESALGAVGRRERVDLGDVSIDSRVSLLPGRNRTYVIGVELDVKLPQVVAAEEAGRLVAAAHEVCPYRTPRAATST